MPCPHCDHDECDYLPPKEPEPHPAEVIGFIFFAALGVTGLLLTVAQWWDK